MGVNDIQGVKPWLDYSNWTITGRGKTQEGKEMIFYAPPSEEVAAAWKDDPEYQAWLEERAAAAQKKIEQWKQDKANGVCKAFNFQTSDGVFVRLDMTSEGTSKLTAEQLAYFKQKYGDADELTYDILLQMYAELANLGAIPSRVAFNEIRMAASPASSSNDIDELLKLIMNRYKQENYDLELYRGSRTCDILIEQSQTKYVEGLNNLHKLLSSIFDR